jgi:hypothetical protein
MSIPNDPGGYPGRPSPGDFMHMPGCAGASGGTCYCFGGPLGRSVEYTPKQQQVQGRVNLLRIANLVLILPFLICLGLLADPHSGTRALASIFALLIVAVMIRNKVVGRRLRRKHGVR